MPPPRVNPGPYNETTLLDALKGGDDSALNRLIERWEQPLFAFAWRYMRNSADAQDLVAETFVRLYQHRARLRPETRLSGWLFTTLSNLCHNQHRWRQRHPAVSLEVEPGDAGGSVGELPDKLPDPATSLARDEAVGELLAAMDRLPHDLRTALLLHYFEHLPYREIAAIVGCSERGVETRLYRARQRLRADLSVAVHETAAS